MKKVKDQVTAGMLFGGASHRELGGDKSAWDESCSWFRAGSVEVWVEANRIDDDRGLRKL